MTVEVTGNGLLLEAFNVGYCLDSFGSLLSEFAYLIYYTWIGCVPVSFLSIIIIHFDTPKLDFLLPTRLLFWTVEVVQDVVSIAYER